MDSDSSAGQHIHQNIVVLRHGDRIDHFDPLWTKTAGRPWDPPLILDGKVRAFSTGKKLNKDLGFPIHRVFVSPFLRCLQTASEVVHAICAVGDDSVTHMSSADGVVIDPSKLKVSVEYGLCEALNTAAILPESAPKDGDFGFNISECEKLLPKGTVDSSVERVYKELPKWEEPEEGARDR
uniref:Histidine phosphatase superfamily, clade-1 n=1 Tax=Tanacetum cinerariifolium TaxID=118510 RepID=A0A699IYP4_TANCI|nr:histidine phosphatase superfamily, clade-1 [Tanacetum cinerariifolium]